ncbi:thermonuclease family protein [Halapricum hydrolyticum]|uniref:Thermonuclease family protein n=1 Tax=Halapricum hydrolyticum TaxID=2979991 RepID=A0AAE3I8W7_9EURY|nr:thermonuclease family protein [Halapricum hydrolyticum]MCU4717039.1 thermonuclease family protein [Halapricum hydrolyticum]MCU4725965.1 thermonuclease family protein [Halapricum hydrolyticum]
METRTWLLVGLVALVALAGCSITVERQSSTGGALNGTVVEVVDGDTIDVRLTNGTVERIRLLGINTPEVHVETQPDEYEGVPDTEAGRACLRAAGENASRVVEDRLAGERVTLRLDSEADTRGGYGRVLAIVVHDNQSINYQLVRDGHARLYDTDFSARDRYAAGETAAKDANRGLWACRAS